MHNDVPQCCFKTLPIGPSIFTIGFADLNATLLLTSEHARSWVGKTPIRLMR